MRIAFFLAHFSLRGTEVANFDYARYAEEILGHEAIVIAQSGHPASNPDVQRKFASRFRTFLVDNFQEVDAVIKREGADLLYILKSGEYDGRVSKAIPTAVHAVFPVPLKEVHGTHFAFVSMWLSKHVSGGTVPVVPHMISLPPATTNVRETLGISKSATVFGCYGGSRSFDIPGAQRAVERVLARRPDAYFLGMNLDRFADHERAIFLPGSADLQDKANFISACDAMLHARYLGESFGIACGEFSAFNKPVITYGDSPQRSHLEILGKKAIIYRTENGLDRILSEFDRKDVLGRNWDAYSDEHSPKSVMGKFSQVYIEGVKPSRQRGRALIEVGRDRVANRLRRVRSMHETLLR